MATSVEVRHFLLTGDGRISEFSAEAATMIAAGARKVPEFADRRVRYLQLMVDDESGTELKVRTAGAFVRFDADGRLSEAGPPSENEQITRFEHDAVVQWALRDRPAVAPIFH